MNSPCCADGTIVLIEEGKLERQVSMGCPLAPRVVHFSNAARTKCRVNNLLAMPATLPKISAEIAAVTSGHVKAT